MKFPTSGFTLLELLVVIVLISLLILIVPPAIFNDGTRSFNAAVQTALNALKQARLEAVMERRSKNVVFAKPETGIEDESGSWFHQGIKVELSGVEGSDDGPALAQVRFYPDGSSSGGKLIFRGSRLSKRIKINAESGGVEFEHE